jgi:hypothetical protein
MALAMTISDGLRRDASEVTSEPLAGWVSSRPAAAVRALESPAEVGLTASTRMTRAPDPMEDR